MESKQIRTRARENLAGNWPLAIAVAAVAFVLSGLIHGSSFIPNIDSPEIRKVLGFLTNQRITVGMWTFSFRGGIFGLVGFLIGGTIQLGYTQFLLKQHDGRGGEFSDLFSQFHRFGQGFAQYFLRSLYVLLWSLLMVIPGIMANYSYALTPYLMADNPTLSATEAINQSKELMDGHKADLFLLDLSFFGWFLLSALTANLGFLALNPYTNAARTVFYRNLVGTAKPVLEAEIV